MKSIFKLIMVIGLLSPLLSAHANITAEIRTEQGYRRLELIDISRGELNFRIEGAPSGVQSSIELDSVLTTIFDVEYDRAAVFAADRERNWVRAAGIILRGTSSTLPFLALPENNAIEPVFRAGQYLERAANNQYISGDPEKVEASRRTYEQAYRVLDAVAKADWSYLSEPAKLKAANCQAMLGNMENARRIWRNAREPDPYDGAFGQYWLTRGRMLFQEGQVRDAADAFAKTVIFDSKNGPVFCDALLMLAQCHEQMLEYHRARDVYFELARLFRRTEWGEKAIERLKYIMENELTAEDEPTEAARVFFALEEDMNTLVKELLNEIREEEKGNDQ